MLFFVVYECYAIRVRTLVHELVRVVEKFGTSINLAEYVQYR